MPPPSGRQIEKLRVELQRLMLDHVKKTAEQTFLGISSGEFREEKERMQRIREVSAYYLEALKRISDASRRKKQQSLESLSRNQSERNDQIRRAG